jgi:hypothetical protein
MSCALPRGAHTDPREHCLARHVGFAHESCAGPMGRRTAAVRQYRRGERTHRRARNGLVEPAYASPRSSLAIPSDACRYRLDARRFGGSRADAASGTRRLVEGLFGQEEVVDLPERARRALDKLGDIRALFETVLDLASDETKSATDRDMETTIRHMREMTKNAEHEIHAVVLACGRASSSGG